MKGDPRPHLRAIVALSRPASVLPFVSPVTLLGAAVGGARLDERVLIVWLANILAVAFAFMINDVEDAPDDALVPAKAARNPISAGRLTPRVGYVAAALVGAAGLALYSTLGLWPFTLGGACLALGILYSWRPVRLKAIPVVDLASHVLMLAALQLLCAYTAFQPQGLTWLLPCLLVSAVSAYGQLVNQVRDLDGDLRAGITNTTSRVGLPVARALMTATAAVAGASLLLAVGLGIVPWWVVLSSAVLTGAIVFHLARRSSLPNLMGDKSLEDLDHTHAVVHIPVLVSGTICLLVWLIVG